MPCSQRFDQVLSSWNEVLPQKQEISRSSYEEDNQLDSDRKHRSYVYSCAGIGCIQGWSQYPEAWGEPAEKIDQGIKSGQITPKEAKIKQDEARMKADGKLTKKERAKLTKKQNKASKKRSIRRNITRKRSTQAKPNSCNWRKLTGYERSRPFFFRIPPVLSLHNPCPGKFFIRRRQAYKRLLQASPA